MRQTSLGFHGSLVPLALGLGSCFQTQMEEQQSSILRYNLGSWCFHIAFKFSLTLCYSKLVLCTHGHKDGNSRNWGLLRGEGERGQGLKTKYWVLCSVHEQRDHSFPRPQDHAIYPGKK